MRTEPYTGDLRDLALAAVGGTLVNDNPVYILCPIHEDNNRPSLAVYHDHAHCYTCGGHLTRAQFSAAYSGKEKWLAKLARYTGTITRVSTPVVPVDVSALIQSSVRLLWQQPEKLAYLYGRGLSAQTLVDYQLGYSGCAYTLPLLSAPQTVRFRRDDTFTTEGNKYWGLRGQNSVRLYPFALEQPIKTLLLTEGEFDALLLRQRGADAYSLTNGALAIPSSDVLRGLFAQAQRVVLVRDQDAPGRRGSERLSQALAAADIPVVDIQWSVEEFGGKDISDVWKHNTELFDRLVTYLEDSVYAPH